jgi:hypothetical protein
MATKPATSPKHTPKVEYENNPFFIASNGLTLFFNLAKSVAIFLLVLSLLSIVLNMFSNAGEKDGMKSEAQIKQVIDSFSGYSLEHWLTVGGIALIIVVTVMLISALINGIAAHASVQVAKGKKVTLAESFHATLDHIWEFVWLRIVVNVKIFLWTLLFIVPGVIMSVRYSLANQVFFDENKTLRGNAAVKESIRLTRGAWLTTFAAPALFNLVTLGIPWPAGDAKRAGSALQTIYCHGQSRRCQTSRSYAFMGDVVYPNYCLHFTHHDGYCSDRRSNGNHHCFTII